MSIISYFGRRTVSRRMNGPRPPSTIQRWDLTEPFGTNVKRLPLLDQVRCYLDQTLGVAYYVKFYGKKCHALVSEYIDEMLIDLGCRALPLFRKELNEEPFKSVVDAIEVLYTFIRTQEWKRGYLKEDVVDEFLTSSPYWAWPSCWGFTENEPCNENKGAWYKPFLIWMNSGSYGNGRSVEGEMLGIIGFDFRSICHYADPHTQEGGHNGVYEHFEKLTFQPRFHSIGTSFSMRETSLDKKFPDLPLLGYLTHFDLGKKTFTKLVGMLSSMALFTDPYWEGQASSHRLCGALNVALLGMYRLSGSNRPVESTCRQLARKLYRATFSAMRELLAYMHDTYGIKAAEYTPIVARLFSCVAEDKQQYDAVAYIRKQGGGASADELKASQEVFGCSLEALQFISQSPTLLSAQSQVVADATENDQGETNKNENAEPPKEGDTSTKETDPKTDDGNKKDAEDDDTSPESDTEEDLGEDDTSSQDDTSTDGSSGSDGSAADTGNPEGDGTTGDNDMPPAEPTQPTQPDTSDDNGIPFKIANPDSETVDSVMFRQEMENFLDDLLANPPEDMSPQDVATLTALQRFWLYCLDVETIVGIVGRCTTLPETLTQLTTQMYGVNKQ